MSGHPMFPDPSDPVETPASRDALVALLRRVQDAMDDGEVRPHALYGHIRVCHCQACELSIDIDRVLQSEAGQ